MENYQPISEFDPQSNQPSKRQWILIATVGFIAICGLLLFISGGALTAYSWYSEQQSEAAETAAAATAVVVERDQAMKAASEWPLVLFEPFDDNTNEWIDGEIDDEYASIQITIDGDYMWEATAKQGFHWRVWPQSDFTTDFFLAVDVAYFYWEIADTQHYRLFSYQNEWIELIPSTYTDAIQPGVMNHLVVVSENDEFKFWINDQFVGQASGSFPSKGQVGVAVGLSYEDEESIIIFDNFELRALSTVE